MERGGGIAGAARLAVGITFVSLGILGILRSLEPAPLAARSARRTAAGEALTPYASGRIDQLRAQLRWDPNAAELNLQLARAYAVRALVQAHQEYSETFPDAFQYGRYPADHFGAWRRGWLCRDPYGDLRRALHHARRARLARPTPPRSVRVQALHLIAHLLRQRSGNAVAIPFLRELVTLAPSDTCAWLHLSEAYYELGDSPHFHQARRRLAALQTRLPSLPITARLESSPVTPSLSAAVRQNRGPSAG
jgi:tetratricopeptide (TPR) repeat protein